MGRSEYDTYEMGSFGNKEWERYWNKRSYRPVHIDLKDPRNDEYPYKFSNEGEATGAEVIDNAVSIYGPLPHLPYDQDKYRILQYAPLSRQILQAVADGYVQEIDLWSFANTGKSTMAEQLTGYFDKCGIRYHSVSLDFEYPKFLKEHPEFSGIPIGKLDNSFWDPFSEWMYKAMSVALPEGIVSICDRTMDVESGYNKTHSTTLEIYKDLKNKPERKEKRLVIMPAYNKGVLSRGALLREGVLALTDHPEDVEDFVLQRNFQISGLNVYLQRFYSRDSDFSSAEIGNAIIRRFENVAPGAVILKNAQKVLAEAEHMKAEGRVNSDLRVPYKAVCSQPVINAAEFAFDNYNFLVYMDARRKKQGLSQKECIIVSNQERRIVTMDAAKWFLQ